MKLFKRLGSVILALVIVLGLFPCLTPVEVTAQDEGLEATMALVMRAWVQAMESEPPIPAMRRDSDNIYPLELILTQYLSNPQNYCKVDVYPDIQSAIDSIQGTSKQKDLATLKPEFEWKTFHGLDAIGLVSESKDVVLIWRSGRMIIYIYTPSFDIQEANEAMWRALSDHGLIVSDTGDPVTPTVPVTATDPAAKPELEVTIRTDRTQYEQGEAVTISGEIRFNGELSHLENIPSKQKRNPSVLLTIYVDVPGSSAPSEGGMIRIKETDASGKYSIMPFAGWNTGEYKLVAKVNLLESEGTYLKAESETITFEVIEASPVTLEADGVRLAKIVKLYQEQIPDGPMRNIEMALKSSDLKSYRTPFPEGYASAYAESDEYKRLGETIRKGMLDPELRGLERIPFYGSENNLNSGRFPGLGEFACGGYQGQVLEFFDGLRFHPDPEVRELLKGLDYGPIARGFYLGDHHSVVLYPIGTLWDGGWTAQALSIPKGPWLYVLNPIREAIMEQSYVFDPWPTQKPEVYSVVKFEGGYGFSRVSSEYADNTDPAKIFSGYPFTGGVIYSNFEGLGEARMGSPETPKSSVAVNCPVDVLVTDASGKRQGILPDGRVVQEFSAYVYHAMENGETQGWYFGLNEGSYDFEITGTDTGTFRLQVSGELADGKLLDYGEQPITAGERVSINLDVDDPGAALILPDGSKVTPTVVEVGGSRGGGEMSRWLLIGIAVGSFLLALALAVLLKFLPIRARLIVFLVVLLGGLIGGVFGTGHNFADLIATIRDWSQS